MSTVDSLRSPLQALADHNHRIGDATCFIDAESGQTATWHQWHKIVDRAASQLFTRGLGTGDLVCHLGENHPATWSAALGSWKIGADFWPMNYRWTEAELNAALTRLDRKVGLLITDGGTLDLEAVERRKFWDQCVSPRPISPVDDADQEGRLLMTTSGSTGEPKFVSLGLAKLGVNASTFASMTELNADDRVLVCAPNFHVAGFAALTAAAIEVGACLVFARRFDPEAIAATIETHRVTATVMVPTMWRALLDAVSPGDRRLSQLRFGICGGAPMAPQLPQRAASMGFELLQGYGMTEAGPMVTLMPPGTLRQDRPGLYDSAGIAPTPIEVRIIDPDGLPVLANKTGQIAIRGPNLVDRYIATTAGDADPFQDGFFHSGDLGHLDDDGFLYVEGRIDDLIISGGENIAPVEVENALCRNPKIAEAAVFGVPDELWGQQVVAFVVGAQGEDAIDFDAVIDGLRSRLAGFKLPRELRIISALPWGPSGKIQRQLLSRLWYQHHPGPDSQ